MFNCVFFCISFCTYGCSSYYRVTFSIHIKVAFKEPLILGFVLLRTSSMLESSHVYRYTLTWSRFGNEVRIQGLWSRRIAWSVQEFQLILEMLTPLSNLKTLFHQWIYSVSPLRLLLLSLLCSQVTSVVFLLQTISHI